MNYLLKKVLHKALEYHFANIDQDTEISLYDGKISLRKLLLSKQSMNEACKGLPGNINVEFGGIQKLDLQIPWSHITTQSVEVQIENFEIVMSISSNIARKSSMNNNQNDVSEQEIEVNQSQIQKIITRILNNVKIQVKNISITICLFDDIQIQLSIDEINSFSIDDFNNYNYISQHDIIKRLVEMNNFRIKLQDKDQTNQIFHMEQHKTVIKKMNNQLNCQINFLQNFLVDLKLSQIHTVKKLIQSFQKLKIDQTSSQPQRKDSKNNLNESITQKETKINPPNQLKQIPHLEININFQSLEIKIEQELSKNDQYLIEGNNHKYILLNTKRYVYQFLVKSLIIKALIQNKDIAIGINFDDIKLIENDTNQKEIVRIKQNYIDEKYKAKELQDNQIFVFEKKQQENFKEKYKNYCLSKIKLNNVKILINENNILNFLNTIQIIQQFLQSIKQEQNNNVQQEENQNQNLQLEINNSEQELNLSQTIENIMDQLDTNNKSNQSIQENMYICKEKTLIECNHLKIELYCKLNAIISFQLEQSIKKGENIQQKNRLIVEQLSVYYIFYQPIIHTIQIQICYKNNENINQISGEIINIQVSISDQFINQLAKLQNNFENPNSFQKDYQFYENDKNNSQQIQLQKKQTLELESNKSQIHLAKDIKELDVIVHMNNIQILIGQAIQNKNQLIFQEFFEINIERGQISKNQNEIQSLLDFSVLYINPYFLEKKIIIQNNRFLFNQCLNQIHIDFQKDFTINLESQELFEIQKLIDNIMNKQQSYSTYFVKNQTNKTIFIFDSQMKRFQEILPNEEIPIFSYFSQEILSIKIGENNDQNQIIFSQAFELKYPFKEFYQKINIIDNENQKTFHVKVMKIKGQKIINIFSNFYILNLSKTINMDLRYQSIQLNKIDELINLPKLFQKDKRVSFDLTPIILQIDKFLQICEQQQNFDLQKLLENVLLSQFDLSSQIEDLQNFNDQHFSINQIEFQLLKKNSQQSQLIKKHEGKKDDSTFLNIDSLDDQLNILIIKSQIYMINQLNLPIKLQVYDHKKQYQFSIDLINNEYTDFIPGFQIDFRKRYLYFQLCYTFQSNVYQSEKFYINFNHSNNENKILDLVDIYNQKIQFVLKQQQHNNTTLIFFTPCLKIINKTPFDFRIQFQDQINKYLIEHDDLSYHQFLFKNEKFSIQEITMQSFVSVDNRELRNNDKDLNLISFNYVKVNENYTNIWITLNLINQNEQQILVVENFINLQNDTNFGLYFFYDNKCLQPNQNIPLTIPYNPQKIYNNKYIRLNQSEISNFCKQLLADIQKAQATQLNFVIFQKNSQQEKNFILIQDNRVIQLSNLMKNQEIDYELQNEEFILNLNKNYDASKKQIQIFFLKNIIKPKNKYAIIKDHDKDLFLKQNENNLQKLKEYYKSLNQFSFEKYDNLLYADKIQNKNKGEIMNIELNFPGIIFNFLNNEQKLTLKTQLNVKIENENFSISAEYLQADIHNDVENTNIFKIQDQIQIQFTSIQQLGQCQNRLKNIVINVQNLYFNLDQKLLDFYRQIDINQSFSDQDNKGVLNEQNNVQNQNIIFLINRLEIHKIDIVFSSNISLLKSNNLKISLDNFKVKQIIQILKQCLSTQQIISKLRTFYITDFLINFPALQIGLQSFKTPFQMIGDLFRQKIQQKKKVQDRFISDISRSKLQNIINEPIILMNHYCIDTIKQKYLVLSQENIYILDAVNLQTEKIPLSLVSDISWNNQNQKLTINLNSERQIVCRMDDERQDNLVNLMKELID